MNKKNNRKGFTVVELVIVIAVIAILATVLIPTFGNMIQKANDSKAMQEARNEFTAYMIDHAQEGAFDAIVVVDGKYFFVVDDGNFVTENDNLKDHGTYDAAKTAVPAPQGYQWPAAAEDGVNVLEPVPAQGGNN